MKNTKNYIKRSAKKMGLPTVGDFIILFRNQDIFSGIAIDGAPSATYIWTFVLPIYDDLSFLHMSLGERVLTCDVAENCLEVGLEEYKRRVSDIKTPRDMVEYLDRNSLNSEYADWIRLLSIIRARDYQKVDKLLNRNDAFLSQSIAAKYAMLRSSFKTKGWDAVQNLLDSWSTNTGALLVNVPCSA